MKYFLALCDFISITNHIIQQNIQRERSVIQRNVCSKYFFILQYCNVFSLELKLYVTNYSSNAKFSDHISFASVRVVQIKFADNSFPDIALYVWRRCVYVTSFAFVWVRFTDFDFRTLSCGIDSIEFWCWRHAVSAKIRLFDYIRFPLLQHATPKRASKQTLKHCE